MSWVATAIAGSAVIGGVSSYLGGKEQAKGIKGAAETTLQTTRESMAYQERMLDRLIDLQEPFRKEGVEALPELAELARGDFTETPYFKYQQEEGEEAINRGISKCFFAFCQETSKYFL